MNSNFERLETQLYFENILGCYKPEDLKEYQKLANGLTINREQAENFKKYCKNDAANYLFKGYISILSAISGLAKGRLTWPMVQLYYAVYYFLRSEILMRNRCILRANQIFTVRGVSGSKIEKVPNKSAKSDHTLTILFAENYLSDVDILMSQTIDGEAPYKWLQRKREQYQYKLRRYSEFDNHSPFFPFEDMELIEQIKMFLADSDPYFCFDADYAALALPLKRCQLSQKNCMDYDIALSQTEKAVLQRFGSEGAECQRMLQLII